MQSIELLLVKEELLFLPVMEEATTHYSSSHSGTVGLKSKSNKKVEIKNESASLPNTQC